MDSNIKLHLACSQDDTKPRFSHIKATRERCIATDGHIAAIIPTAHIFTEEVIEHIPEQGILIHSDDYKRMLPYEDVRWKTEGKVLKATHSKKRPLLIEVTSEEELDLEYPDIDRVWPEDDLHDPIYVIGLDPRLLHNLSQALGFDKLSPCALEFTGASNRPILVSSAHSQDDLFEGRKGIIMPYLIKEPNS